MKYLYNYMYHIIIRYSYLIFQIYKFYENDSIFIIYNFKYKINKNELYDIYLFSE